MRYKRRRNYRSKIVKMKFQSFVDIATQADNMQIISVSAGGKNVVQRLSPFFGAYKYYKLGGVSIKLIPASTLPVDPTGLSYEAGENTVDPRDQLTPGMCRITNGEDILENITGLNGDQQRQLYDNMLLDPRWFKWMLQSGVKRFGKPRYWQIGQLHQDKWPGACTNIPMINSGGTVFQGTAATFQDVVKDGDTLIPGSGTFGVSSPTGIFQTGHRGVLGWLPTDGLQNVNGMVSNPVPLIASVPTVELFKVLTPPMHKTNYYYRMFITETVYFKDPIVMSLNGYRPIDVFHQVRVANPVSPTYAYPDISIPDAIDGGNDGGS